MSYFTPQSIISLAWVGGSGLTMKNRLINGDFSVLQRGYGGRDDGQYGLDRWYALTSTTTVDFLQLANSNSPYVAQLVQNQSGTNRFGIAQVIECANCKDLRGQAVVLRAEVLGFGTSPIPVRWAILEHTGTEDDVTRDVVASWTNTNFTPGNFFISGVNVLATGSVNAIDSGWISFDTSSVSAVCDNSMNNLIVFIWTDSALAQNSGICIKDVQLERGNVATEFDRRSVGLEMMLCQRYYCQSYRRWVPPGTAPSSSGQIAVYTPSVGALAVRYNVRFPVKMRTIPTITVYASTSGTANRVTRGTTDQVPVIEFVTEDSAQIGTDATNSSNIFRFQYTADAEL